MNDAQTFGDLLKTWRGDQPVDQARKAVGVAWNTYRDWEAGRTFPRELDLRALTVVLDRPVEELRAAVAAGRTQRDTVANGSAG